MNAASTTSCIDIISCLREEHESLREQLAVLRSPGVSAKEARSALERFWPSLDSHVRAEEEVVLSRALELEDLRFGAVKALEEHELTDCLAARVKQSADEVQFSARLAVLCDLVEQQLAEREQVLFPGILAKISGEEREEMGMRFREVKERNELAPVLSMPARDQLLASETGKIGYIIAWLLGVPFWILLLVFLIRGH